MSKLMQNKGEEYHGFDIEFKPPVVLQAGKQYMLEASMDGPPSWYGWGGSSQVKHPRVTFSFENMAERVLRENVPEVRWPISATAKLTFSRQNLLFHGKTYFSTAKLTFPRQNLLFHGKTYFSTAKLKRIRGIFCVIILFCEVAVNCTCTPFTAACSHLN